MNDKNNDSTPVDEASIKQKELAQIRDALHVLNNHKVIRTFNSMPRMLAFQFFRGVAFGLGSVIGATIVVSLLISFLAQIEFIPIIGEWAVQIMQEIQPTLPENPSIDS